MIQTNRGAMIASILILIAITASACNQPYSQAPVSTNTPLPGNLFATPLGPAEGNPMQTVAVAATETAQLTGTSPTSTGIAVTPQSATPTAPIVAATTTVPTSTLAVATGTLAVPTTIPSGSRPASYTLQAGEFVYCIARRFNVDPDEILALNGIFDSQTVYPGLTVKIPQSGNTFPGSRMLHKHPDTYTVDSSSETIYGVACYYGDIDPARIAQANNLPISASLSAGQRLSIP